MSERLNISFKDTELEKRLLEHLKKESELIGVSNYIKQLLLEDMNKKSTQK